MADSWRGLYFVATGPLGFSLCPFAGFHGGVMGGSIFLVSFIADCSFHDKVRHECHEENASQNRDGQGILIDEYHGNRAYLFEYQEGYYRADS